MTTIGDVHKQWADWYENVAAPYFHKYGMPLQENLDHSIAQRMRDAAAGGPYAGYLGSMYKDMPVANPVLPPEGFGMVQGGHTAGTSDELQRMAAAKQDNAQMARENAQPDEETMNRIRHLMQIYGGQQQQQQAPPQQMQQAPQQSSGGMRSPYQSRYGNIMNPLNKTNNMQLSMLQDDYLDQHFQAMTGGGMDYA